jgi:SAM-dependent methyltransferase
MAERGLFASMVAVDISAGAIEVAQREAASRGLTQIDFQQADVNTMSLPAEAYDVVFMNMSLHHISALERVAAQINKTLRPGGVFLANEFVGPSQFQYPDQRLEMVRHRLSLLPERLRWNPIAKEIKREYPRYPRRHWVAYDPTESVRSDEIPRILHRNFPAMRRYDYGGSILNLALENIHHNFDLASPEDMAHLRDLIEFERSMIRSGILASDFAYFVCPRGPRFVRLRERVRGRFDVRHRLTMMVRRHGLG